MNNEKPALRAVPYSRSIFVEYFILTPTTSLTLGTHPLIHPEALVSASVKKNKNSRLST